MATFNDEQMLKSAGLYGKDLSTGKEGYNLACILLFGKDETIRMALPHYKTDAIFRKVNLDRYDDRDIITCNLIESYERLINFVIKHLDDPFYLEKDVRVSVRFKLFREMIANMLIHREFSNGLSARFIIEPNVVYSENANRPNGYGVLDINSFVPYPKNPLIASVFKEIGFAEELGSGVERLFKTTL